MRNKSILVVMFFLMSGFVSLGSTKITPIEPFTGVFSEGFEDYVTISRPLSEVNVFSDEVTARRFRKDAPADYWGD